MRRLAAIFLMAAGVAYGQAARDLTVRVFDADRVGSVTVSPLHGGATWKRCGGCRREALSGSVVAGAGAEFVGEVKVESDGGRHAAAAGIWRIDAEKDGIRVRLTLPSERYVAAVLNGEASADEPAASLRALAVTVRSFALDRAARGEELCDSTRCQAMRLGAVSAAVQAAVMETSGETLWFGGARVPGYFTQSSGGVAEDAASAWGGAKKPWLRVHPDPYSERLPSAWHTEVGGEDLAKALGAEGFRLRSAVRSLAIVKKDPSGRAAEVEVRGDGESLKIPASSLRFAVNRSLGWGRLRSDLYTVQMGAGERAIFEGKGFGHGVGLSQSGARVMAGEGRDDREILKFYFPGTQVRVEGGDSGWRRHEGDGFTLFDVDGGVSTDDIAAALKRAKELFPSSQGPLVLRVFPSTVLYRGVTGEPGWTLGAARGDAVFLQPKSVVGKGLPDLLVHEFLHVLVEREASADAPLWLREGLVEVLAGGTGVAVRTRAAVDESLRAPGSLVESQGAHREAGGMVRKLAGAYGMERVREWLKRGVPEEAVVRIGLK